MDIEFVLLDVSSTLTDELRSAFKEHLSESTRNQFTIVHSWLDDLKPPNSLFDCIVSPANSYGILDGGFDYYLSKALAPKGNLKLPTQIAQSVLYDRWGGYAPPGTCTIVSLLGTPCASNPHSCSYIALCPTMRAPENVTWNREVVYNCIWSLLKTLDDHNRPFVGKGRGGSSSVNGKKISKVVMTGLATGTGGVSAKRYAQQLALAFKHFEDSKANPDRWSALVWKDVHKFTDEVDKTHNM